jgi:uncharacterized protein (TIGR03435 family)
MTLLVPHLWQSTLCALIAWTLTLALRKNRAAVRYWIWLAASLKFLVPLSLLVSVGAQFAVRTATSSAQPQLSAIVNQISAPAGLAPVTAAPVSAAPDRLPAVLFGLWLCGAAVVLLIWFRTWWNIRALRRAATPLDLSLPIPVMSSAARLEPGVFGVFRPALLLPEGIANRLTPDQLETVLAHELCHVRRRDNLTAVLHMLVETLFWFHPLVWWIGSRLADERERACDEAVLQIAGEPEVYAEGILEVCRLYLESPIACMSGISGADLRARIQRIISGARAHNITRGRKLLLATVALAVAGVPLLIGVLTPRVGRAQPQAEKSPEFEVASSAMAAQVPNGAAPYEVASVKPSDPNQQTAPGTWGITGSRFYATNLSAQALVFIAYSIEDPGQISGLPKWASSERFTIEARLGGDVSGHRSMSVQEELEQSRAILKPLLQDRFGLKVHYEAREKSIYALVVDKHGPKLQKASDDHSVWNVTRGHISIHAATLAPLVEGLSTAVGRLVVDKTSLPGRYNIDLKWAPDELSGGENPGPSVFTALREQLGLRLISTSGSIEVLVIDQLERPSAN